MFNDISCDNKGNEEESLENAKVRLRTYKEVWYRTMVIYWSRFPRRSGLLWKRIVPKEFGGHIAEKMLLEFAECGCPIFRATTPLSRGKLKSKGHGKLSIHFAADVDTIDPIFRFIVCCKHV